MARPSSWCCPSCSTSFLPAFLGLFGIEIFDSGRSHAELMIFGALIVWFLIVEPHGLAKLWSTAKQKLRLCASPLMSFASFPRASATFIQRRHP